MSFTNSAAGCLELKLPFRVSCFLITSLTPGKLRTMFICLTRPPHSFVSNGSLVNRSERLLRGSMFRILPKVSSIRGAAFFNRSTSSTGSGFTGI